MGANAGSIKLELMVTDNGAVVVRDSAVRTQRALENTKRKALTVSSRIRSSFRKLGKSVTGMLLNWKTALAALAGGAGLGALARSAIGVAAKFEKMRLSLDTITKGQGEQWFKRLNEWALRMPVNTEKAIESFIMMRAMGLQPTIDQMTTLVDTMSALGGGADTLTGIARALGQMSTKGKVSAEELMQLAERGIPAYDILAKAFGNVETSSINAKDAIEAIFTGLKGRFGGQAEKMQTTWSGMITTLRSFWTEFQRMVMESGLFDKLKEKVGIIKDWVEDAFRTGKMLKWANAVSDFFVDIIDKITNAFNKILEWVKKAFVEINVKMEAASNYLKTALLPLYGIGKGLQIAGSFIPGGGNSPAVSSGGMVGMGGYGNFGPPPGGASTADMATTPAGFTTGDVGSILAAMNQGLRVQGAGGGKVTIVNNLSQKLSKNDVADIVEQQKRQADRSGSSD